MVNYYTYPYSTHNLHLWLLHHSISVILFCYIWVLHMLRIASCHHYAIYRCIGWLAGPMASYLYNAFAGGASQILTHCHFLAMKFISIIAHGMDMNNCGYIMIIHDRSCIDHDNSRYIATRPWLSMIYHDSWLIVSRPWSFMINCIQTIIIYDRSCLEHDHSW